MDLLAATPTFKTSKFKFIDPDTDEPACTDKGDEMHVTLYGPHTIEFMKKEEEKRKRMRAIAKKYSLKKGGEINAQAIQDAAKCDIQFQCDITKDILVQINGKTCTSKKEFYSNKDLSPWILEIAKFIYSKKNFMPN